MCLKVVLQNSVIFSYYYFMYMYCTYHLLQILMNVLNHLHVITCVLILMEVLSVPVEMAMN